MLAARALLLSLTCVSSLPLSVASAETAANEGKHLGVASCATSVCHGKSISRGVDPCRPKKEEDVDLREAVVWQECDLHFAAFTRLRGGAQNPLAQRIADNLGLASPWTQKLCLDCHSDNAYDGKDSVGKFRLSDGVGCEACHGGSEHWIDSHKDPKATHAENLQRGMYPTEQPLKRAQLCLSCHLGTKDRFATHAILGAGHPRLAFELEVYTRLQPAHYVVDEAYIKRKGHIEGMNLWVTGQIESAERYLTLLQTDLAAKPGSIVPELAFYDCFGCHHAVEKTEHKRWSQSRAGVGIRPGTVRLQRQNLLMLQAFTESLAPAELPDLKADTDALVRAGQIDEPSVRAAAQKLLGRLRADEGWSSRAYSIKDISSVRRTLLRYAADDKTSDFAAAEQVVLALDSLSNSLNDADRHKSDLDVLYKGLGGADTFDPKQFAAVAKRLEGAFSP